MPSSDAICGADRYGRSALNERRIAIPRSNPGTDMSAVAIDRRRRHPAELGVNLRSRLALQNLSKAHEPGVVRVEHLARARAANHPFENDSVLFQHFPVQTLEAGAIKEPPCILLPARNLAAPPEKHAATVDVDRCDHADNRECTTRTRRGPIGNGQAQP